MTIFDSKELDTRGIHMDIDSIHKALANPVRRDILQWLKEPQLHFPQQDHPFEMGVCCKQIDQRTGLSQSTVSVHLATLQRAGLVTTRRVGQWVFFQRNEEVIQAFLAQLNHGL
jgi:ArsR family transcriptional regulator